MNVVRKFAQDFPLHTGSLMFQLATTEGVTHLSIGQFLYVLDAIRRAQKDYEKRLLETGNKLWGEKSHALEGLARDLYWEAAEEDDKIRDYESIRPS